MSAAGAGPPDIRTLSALSTVTVDNHEVGSTGTWITTWGANAETDAELTTRLPLPSPMRTLAR